MKLGIITLIHRNDNYGGTLQAYAMQEVLKSLGHSAAFLNASVAPLMIEWNRLFEKPIRTIQCLRRYCAFVPFWKTYLNYDRNGHRDEAVFLKSPTECDGYIVGSDQIWGNNRLLDPALFRFSFADFGSADALRIAYAPSFGATAVDKLDVSKLAGVLAGFDSLSVREEDARLLLERCGCLDVDWVCDPTLLQPRCFWEKLICSGDCPRPQGRSDRLFFGAYRWKTVLKNRIALDYVAKKRHLRLLVPCSETPMRFLGHNKVMGPIEWLRAIRDSGFVVTNSFHCMVFSILFHKPFVVLKLGGHYVQMNARVESLAKRLGLSARLVQTQEELEAAEASAIDWESVDARLESWRTASMGYLKRALAGKQ